MTIYAYGGGSVVAVLYKEAKKRYLLLTYDRATKSITKGQWLKGTDVKHNKCCYHDGKFTYVTLNYSSIDSKHNEKGVGYRCTSTAPFFTANSPIEWFGVYI